MILVDTSVWIDHFRSSDAELILALNQGNVVQHPFVTAEIALGNLAQRDEVCRMLALLPQVKPCSDAEIIDLIDQLALPGTGIGMVDAYLLVSVWSNSDLRLWTRDRRLLAAAQRLKVAFEN